MSRNQKEYCIYLTHYLGNKLPPWYFGSGTISKIENGYNGSVSSKKYKKIWVQERKNNPHLFKTKILRKFYKRNMATIAEYIYQKRHNLIYNDKYMNKSLAIKWYRINNTFNDEHRDNLSKSHFDQVHCIDENGVTLTVTKNEFYNNSNLISVHLGYKHTEKTN